MWWILLLSCWLYPSSWSMTWFPPVTLNVMRGEQIDLVDITNSTYAPIWMKNTANNGIRIEGPESVDMIDSAQSPINSVDRDREPLDEVERIEPRQWPGRPDILPTRSTAPFTTERSLPPRSPQPTTLAQRNPSSQRFPTITVPPPTVTVDELFCDFGPSPSMPLCEWQNGNGALDWTAGTGMGTNWVGGPSADATSGTMEGGYAFVETSQIPLKDVKYKSSGGLLHSPQLGSTGVAGTCFMFKYIMDGLSIAGLRVLLHVGTDEYSFKKEPEELPVENTTVIPPCEPVEIMEERVLWHAQYYTLGVWQQAQILYTYPELHSLVIEGVPVDSTDPSRLYRGYIAIDDIDLQPGTSCVGFCNFASSFCDWNNDAEDDFDWTISRGSGNPTTGPTMDSSSDRVTAGGYAFIDSSFPRRPGDTAKLISSSFPATMPDAPTCMRFWFHMFGSGIGYLKLFLRHFRSPDSQLREIWGLSGNAGNAWFMSQVTISSLDDFQLLFEASVGNTGMGDIAIDDLSYGPGACPGVLRLYVQADGDTSTESKPIWQLYNDQGPTWNYAQTNINQNTDFNVVFEGTWGPNRASGSIGIDDIAFYTGNCSVKPPSAVVRAEDCSFEKDLCGWENITVSDNDRAVTWQRAFQTHRPAQLLDRTFGATGDFVFFDIFTNNKESTKVQLQSPLINASPDEEFVCFTFWFAAFGVEESTALQVIKMPAEETEGENEDEQEQPLWSLTAKGINNPRPVWMAAQVTIEARTPYRLILEGSASNGGFAVDDIKFQPLSCTIRPANAQPIQSET
ncbi:MAM and LDL-receptor class A domain-containing protein 1-like isoform X3 [Pogonomyrmex barbatus]|uniref:MAM and LDL-receptor class A domain-containing protein 1-like isoform X3 n=1 Tax=Pogonomyrmex barbatus TaxID=144034 RepID=A0A8N1S285_9HYME|nr:MAM and LDL-receptor class A domain-containing protein 1-like isoform X3 [Pogonomyrmex barbatus]